MSRRRIERRIVVPRFAHVVAVSTVALTLLAGCDRGGREQDADGAVTEAESATVEESTIPAPEAARDTAHGINRFGLSLYRELRAEHGEANLVVSPLSVAAALGLLLPGTVGDSRTQLLGVLHQEDAAAAGAGLRALAEALGQRGDEEGVRLDIANRAFIQHGYPVKPAYLEAIAGDSDAGAETLDFAADPDAARVHINQWVSARTERLIPELMPRGSVSDDTRLVLANALYLLADWDEPFEKDLTAPAPFHLADGSEIQVPMMQDSRRLPVNVDEDWRAAELAYAGDKLALLLVVPDDLDAFLEDFDADRLDRIIDGLSVRETVLTLPKLESRSASSLAEAVATLGAPALFQPGGGLRGIADDERLYVSGIVHQTVLRMDERGTEAAAATGISVSVTSLGPPPVEIRADRPYLLLLRDRESGALLFAGHIGDPR